MSFSNSLQENKIPLIIIILILLGYIAYRWVNEYKKPSRNYPPPGKMCLSRKSQQDISNEIEQKLKEINACDCADTCARLRPPISPLPPVTPPPMIPPSFVPPTNIPSRSEQFGNYNYY
jgi:hypothetical protein